MSSVATIRIATRSSALARWQADWVAARLNERRVATEIVEIATAGDRNLVQQIPALGSIGVFTKEVQQAVLDERADIAVHSLKDLPTAPTAGMFIAAICEREDPADALVTTTGHPVENLAESARVGTGSVRRRAQLLRVRPDLQMTDIRGNVDTRLAKLDRGEVDALVLAAAGLKRLGRQDRITQRLDPHQILPAAGQGALAVECRQDDWASLEALGPLDHGPTRMAAQLERGLLTRLRAGCLAPLGALAESFGNMVSLRAVVLSPDGQRFLQFEGSRAVDQWEELADLAAESLLADGAAEWISDIRT